MLVDLLSALVRGLSFIALFQAAGTAIFLALFGQRLAGGSEGSLRTLGRRSALVAIILVAGQYGLEAARMSGEMSGVMDPSLQSLVLHSSIAGAFALRIAGLLALIAALRMRGTASTLLTVIAVILIATAFALVGHTASHPFRWLLAILLIAHLIVVAFWFGALAPLLNITSREPARTAGGVIEAFSALALWIVPALFGAGLCLALFLLGSVAALATPYGELLVVKVALFAVLMGLAALNKWRLGPGVARGDSRALLHFRRSVVAEYVLIAAVLCVTAVLTTFYSPD